MKYSRITVILTLVSVLVMASVGSAFAKGGPPAEHQGHGPNWAGQKQGLFGNVTAVTEADGNVTVSLLTNQGWMVDLNLTDETVYMMPSVLKGRADRETFVDALGGDLTALEGRRAAATAINLVEDPEDTFTGDAWRLLIVPEPSRTQPLHAHRTGLVTAFSPGGNVTIVDIHGVDHEFDLAGNETEYRPEGTVADDIVVWDGENGSFVTVVSATDPKQNPRAKAVVLHARMPEGWPAPMP